MAVKKEVKLSLFDSFPQLSSPCNVHYHPWASNPAISSPIAPHLPSHPPSSPPTNHCYRCQHSTSLLPFVPVMSERLKYENEMLRRYRVATQELLRQSDDERALLTSRITSLELALDAALSASPHASFSLSHSSPQHSLPTLHPPPLHPDSTTSSPLVVAGRRRGYGLGLGYSPTVVHSPILQPQPQPQQPQLQPQLQPQPQPPIFSGFGDDHDQPSTPPKPSSPEESTEPEVVAALEAELETERATHAALMEAAQAEIAELHAQLEDAHAVIAAKDAAVELYKSQLLAARAANRKPSRSE